MRVFIAIELDSSVKEMLTGLQSRVKGWASRGNFVLSENFHITLRFLGEVDQSDIPSISEAVAFTAVKERRFPLTISRLGSFSRGETSIVWAGLEESRPLVHLFKSLENALEQQGFSRDKKGLSPHITLGREVALYGKPQKVLSNIPMEKKTFEVSQISLMSSIRQGPKMVYTPIFVKNLR
ncbi:MAG: RNA 2',3'-cyclic phosphodiesterase [Clostridiales bacterium]|nr:RNA 2',3'-cyclic phosphodiesterase [Clostridiales bacterium]